MSFAAQTAAIHCGAVEARREMDRRFEEATFEIVSPGGFEIVWAIPKHLEDAKTIVGIQVSVNEEGVAVFRVVDPETSTPIAIAGHPENGLWHDLEDVISTALEVFDRGVKVLEEASSIDVETCVAHPTFDEGMEFVDCIPEVACAGKDDVIGWEIRRDIMHSTYTWARVTARADGSDLEAAVQLQADQDQADSEERQGGGFNPNGD